jgi:spore coat polysaccharide biosynthesis protein SpsF
MTKSHIVAIIQARMASSRLPGKVLLDIDGEPMLAHVVARAQLASLVDRVAVATTSERGDDRVAEFAPPRVTSATGAASMMCLTVIIKRPASSEPM